jgi:glutamate racemase
MVENGSFLSDRNQSFKTIQKTIKANFEDSIDVLVLGSTHLSLIKNYIGDLLPSIKFIDSSSQAAKDAKNYLQFNKDLNKNGTGKLEILVSSNKKEFQDILRYMGTREVIYDVSLQF